MTVSAENATRESVEVAVEAAFRKVVFNREVASPIEAVEMVLANRKRVPLVLFIQCLTAGMTPRQTADKLRISYRTAYQGLRRAKDAVNAKA